MTHQPVINPDENRLDRIDNIPILGRFRPIHNPAPDFLLDIEEFENVCQRRLAFLPIDQSIQNGNPETTNEEWQTYVEYIESMQEMLGGTESVQICMYWARLALNVEDALTCMLMAYAMATRHPHIDERILHLRSKPYAPRPHRRSILRSCNMVLGFRGFVHGWSSSMPDFSVFAHPTVFNFVWPNEWAADSETDGESSFRYGSSGHGSGTDDDSGPPGVATGRPTATGLTSYSDTSSVLSSDSEIPRSRADVFFGSQTFGPCHKRRLIKMDNYLTKWHRERRDRRAIRRARRWARSKFCEESRGLDPRYNLIATRAAMLASDMMKKKIEDRNRLRAEEIRTARRVRKDLRNLRRKVKAQLPGRGTDNVSSGDENSTSDWRRSNRSFHELYKQVIHSWARKFKSTASPLLSNADKTYDCWLTPVRWVQQSGAELVYFFR